MNSRDVTLLSAATVFGAVASAMAVGLFFNFRSPKYRWSQNGVAEQKSSSQSPFDPAKRKGSVVLCRYLSWDDYFMAIAFLSAERSKDPNRQVGACLVSEKGIILGIGYNGFPRGCSMTSFRGLSYVCHAEVNAILNTNHASAAGQVSTTRDSFVNFAHFFLNSGVSEVIYYVEKRLDNPDAAYVASHKLLSMAGVKVRRHQPQMDEILIKFKEF
ncbi:hypothetical protein DH2020_012920 [Rehmannia glutinosa]|uniref:dCMP deaminase n=1 Tax=Rehmannia glutinosa TaxID=99300 RepID=A0ABR0X257_REHGL